MVSFSLLMGGLTLWFAVGTCRCGVIEDGSDALMTSSKSSAWSGRNGFSLGNGKDPEYTHIPPPDLLSKGYASDKADFLEVEKEESRVTQIDLGESMFAKGFQDLRLIYQECQRKMSERLGKQSDGSGVEDEMTKMREKIVLLYKCMKVIGFRRLDDFLSDDVIPVSRYLEFVRDVRNGTNHRISQARMRGHSYAAQILSKNWLDLIMERIRKVLHDHSLKFRLGDDVTEGRGRRRDHRMFAMMMMGFVIMASILVPMGFQFLTVLGGKSLLMAKMALIMSAINGLKKIATSNVGYGLYHAGPEAFHHDPHHHGFHDKIFHVKASNQPDPPFNVVI